MTDRLAELAATIGRALKRMPTVIFRGSEDMTRDQALAGLAELVEIARKQEGLLTEWSLFYPPLPSSNDANLRNRTLAALPPSPEEPTG